jgi:hypothetical protein
VRVGPIRVDLDNPFKINGTYGDWPLQEKGLMEGRELMEGNWDRRLPDTCQSNSKLKGDGIASDSLPNNK